MQDNEGHSSSSVHMHSFKTNQPTTHPRGLIRIDFFIPVHFPVQFSSSSAVKFQNSNTFQYNRTCQIRIQINSSTFQYIPAYVISSQWLEKVSIIYILKISRLTQFSPWLKKILKIGILKGSRLTQFYYFLIINPSFTMVEEHFEILHSFISNFFISNSTEILAKNKQPKYPQYTLFLETIL